MWYTQILVSKHHSQIKWIRLLGEVADFRAGTGKKKSTGGLRTFCDIKKKCSKNDVHISKGHRTQFKGAPTSRIWDNLWIEINNDSNRVF